MTKRAAISSVSSRRKIIKIPDVDGMGINPTASRARMNELHNKLFSGEEPANTVEEQEARLRAGLLFAIGHEILVSHPEGLPFDLTAEQREDLLEVLGGDLPDVIVAELMARGATIISGKVSQLQGSLKRS